MSVRRSLGVGKHGYRREAGDGGVEEAGSEKEGELRNF